MPRLNELPRGESVTGLIYGPSGSGKTFLAGTAGDKTLIITPPNGFATLQSKQFRALGINPYIELIDEPGVPKKATGFDKVTDILDHYLEKFPEIETFIVDDCTNLRRMAMLKGMEIGQAMNRSQSISNVRKFEVITPAVQDFGMEMNLIDTFIRMYTSIMKEKGKHFFMFAHERLTYEKGGAIGELPTLRKISPAFTGQTFPDDVTGLFDITWHTEVKGSGERTFYQIRTAGDSVVTAKTRWGGIFPTLIENAPPLSVLINHIATETPYTNRK